MIVRVKEGFGPFKFSGRGLVLRPGDNSVNPDAKLMVLLKRGAARGKWEIDPPAKAEPAKEEPVAQEPPEEPAPAVEEPEEETSLFSRKRKGKR